MSIRVLLVDDNNLFRKGLAGLISAHPDFTVVADVSTCKEAVQASLHIDPDVVVTDIVLGGVNGLECVAELKRPAQRCMAAYRAFRRPLAVARLRPLGARRQEERQVRRLLRPVVPGRLG